MTDRTAQAEIEELKLMLERRQKEFLSPHGWWDATNLAKILFIEGYTRSNSPDTEREKTSLSKIQSGESLENIITWMKIHYYDQREIDLVESILTRFGTVKVPTVEELGDFIYQTLHTTGREPTNPLSKPVCYELGRLIH